MGALSGLFQDIRFGFRHHAKTPGFSLAAVAVLAAGIGASTAVYSVVDAVLLRPLPYPQPDHIVIPWRQAPPELNLGYAEIPWGRAEFLEFEEQAKVFEHVAAFESGAFNLTGNYTGGPSMPEAVRVDGLRVSAGFFPTFGVAPALGRVFRSDEDAAGHELVAVLGDRLWRERFASDPLVIGRVIQLNGAAYTVIGVMPPGFTFPRAEEMPGSFNFPKEAQLWLPHALPPGPVKRGEPSELAVIGRLRPDASLAEGQAELNLFTARKAQANPRFATWYRYRATPLTEQIQGGSRRAMLLIFLAVGVVLLICCANVAGMTLARSLSRQREFTLRAALGAGRGRLLRQMITESLLLAAGAGGAGILAAQWVVRMVKAYGPADVPRLQTAALDSRALLFGVLVAIAAGLVFSVAPALAAARGSFAESLREGGARAIGSLRGSALRQGLLVFQVALAMSLAIAAGLLTRSFGRLVATDPGFRPARAITFQLTLPPAGYGTLDSMVNFYRDARAKLAAAPGVEAASISESVPMGGAPESTAILLPEHTAELRPYAEYEIASPGYFATMGIPLVAGREFLDTDTADSQPVAIINQALAKKYFRGENPLGKHVGIPIGPRSIVVVGVAPDVKHLSLRQEVGPEMYVPLTQKPWPSMSTMQATIRTRSDTATAVAAARQAIRAVDSNIPLANLTEMQTLVDSSTTQPRFSMLLIACFGALAVLLAAAGMYGVIAYSVAQRTREIGVRVALGALRGDVFRMVLAQGARLAAFGIAIGIVAALAGGKLLAGFLFGVAPADPLTFVAVSALLAAIALGACYLPARAAMRVDPIQALRHD